MLFSKQLPLSSLIEFCRALRHNLGAGLTLRHVFRQQSERGPRPVRPVAARISQELEQGESLEKALKREKGFFPPMFVSMAIVGEQSGCLPEVLTELEKYFLLQQKLWRQFIAQVAWPALCFIAFPFVIAGMIFLLAILSSGSKPFDPLGLGYTGVGGALRFLIHYWGTFALLVVVYFVVTRLLKQRAAAEELLLHIWVIGPCLRAIALMRFCIALRLTMETGMSITNAVRLAMRGTGYTVFADRAESVRQALKAGDDLALALGKSGLFPQDFLNILANAEEGGRVPEVMEHQAQFYEDESRRRLTILSQAGSWGIYGAVCLMIIFMILRLAMGVFGAGGPYDPSYWEK